MLYRIWKLTTKELIQLVRDRLLAPFALLGPLAELLMVAWSTSQGIENLPTAVLDLDRSAASRALVVSLENTGTFRQPEYVSDMPTIEDALVRGTINAALVIPPDYEEEMDSSTGTPTLFFILNGAESTPAIASKRAIEGLALDLGERITIERLGLNPNEFSGFTPSLRVWFNEALSEALYSTPAELGLMLEFTVLLFAALAFSRERELGTLEQLLVMPFSSIACL